MDQPYVLQAIHPFETAIGEVGVTVRRGDKWYRGMKNGDVIVLQQQDPDDRDRVTYVGTGVITNLQLQPFCSIRAADIEKEHEVSSRLYSGLLESMRRAYGEDFSETEMVTVLFYERVR